MNVILRYLKASLDFYKNHNDKEDFLCPICSEGFVKVGTISFGQALKQDVVDLSHKVTADADYFIVLGSSLKVSPANNLIRVAEKHGAKIIILNR